MPKSATGLPCVGETQEDALETAAPGQRGEGAGQMPTLRPAPEQAGRRPGMDAQGDLPTLLALPLPDLRQRLSGCLVYPRLDEDLLMNWFKAKGEISAGAVEGMGNKIRVVPQTFLQLPHL